MFKTTELHPKRVTVWAALSAKEVIGPFFTDKTVTGPWYRELLNKQVIPKMCKRRDFKRIIFYQDGAKAHTANEMLDLLHRIFGQRVISNRYLPRFFEGWFWPPYSSDLSPLDHFLWSYVKSKCYKNDPKTVEELRKEIKRIFREFDNTILPRVLCNFLTRLDCVIENEDSHVEHLLH